MKTKADVFSIIAELKKLYPDGICSLDYPKPYELLFSVRLAAQCTDCLLYTSQPLERGGDVESPGPVR